MNAALKTVNLNPLLLSAMPPIQTIYVNVRIFPEISYPFSPVPSYCDSQHPTCPPVQQAPICNCTSPYYGYNCTSIRCDILTNCSSCNTYPECGWCCDSNTCVHNGVCLQEYPRSCANCSDTCFANNGTCEVSKISLNFH